MHGDLASSSVVLSAGGLRRFSSRFTGVNRRHDVGLPQTNGLIDRSPSLELAGNLAPPLSARLRGPLSLLRPLQAITMATRCILLHSRVHLQIGMRRSFNLVNVYRKLASAWKTFTVQHDGR